MPDDKRRLDQTLDALRRRFGSRVVGRLGDNLRPPPACLPTGFPALDSLLGGGLPRGRIVELAAAPTAGMVTLALNVVAQAQACGEPAVYLDLQHAFDPDYAARCGVLVDRLLLVRPDGAAQAFALLHDLAGGERGVLICDLPPHVVADARLAQALSAALGRLMLPLGRSPTVLLCLVSTPPGRPLPLQHYAAVRLLLHRERWLYQGPDICGCRTAVLLAKNKQGASGQSVTLDLFFGDAAQGRQP